MEIVAYFKDNINTINSPRMYISLSHDGWDYEQSSPIRDNDGTYEGKVVLELENFNDYTLYMQVDSPDYIDIIFPGNGYINIPYQVFYIDYIKDPGSSDENPQTVYLSADGKVHYTEVMEIMHFEMETEPYPPVFTIYSNEGKNITTKSDNTERTTFVNTFNVALTTISDNSEIVYTLDGNEPAAEFDYQGVLNITTGILFEEMFEISGNNSEGKIISIAKSFREGINASEMITKEYTLKVDKPLVKIISENNRKKIVITSITEGARIYYSIDAGIPSPNNGNLYTGSFELPGTGRTLRVVGYKDNYLDSELTIQDLDYVRGSNKRIHIVNAVFFLKK